jgi:hypothetical protein
VKGFKVRRGANLTEQSTPENPTAQAHPEAVQVPWLEQLPGQALSANPHAF